MKKTIKIVAGVALACALAVAPLAACTSASTDSGSESGSAEQASGVDTSSWKTLGDALAAATEDPSYAYDENYFIAEIHVNDSVVRVVAKSSQEGIEKTYDLDFAAEDYHEKFDAIVGEFEIVSAEDITSDQLSQAEMDALVGKTGKELVDDGFKFESYVLYGGEGGSAANMGKGYFTYMVSFDGNVSEDQAEDGGEAIMDAKVTEVQLVGMSMDAMDPTLVD